MSKHFFNLTIVVVCLVAVYGIWEPYSYWWDELYSVSASLAPIPEMMTEWIFPDVHPPLYQLILKGWIVVFSSGEVATRLLSYLCVLLSIVLMILWGRRRMDLATFRIMVVVFASNHVLLAYAQETRSYGMLLLFSTALTILFVESYEGTRQVSVKGSHHTVFADRIRTGFLVIALATSLLHYFGLLYAGTLLLLYLLDSMRARQWKRALWTVATGFLCLVWPIIHFAKGDVVGKTGGNFWIESDGWQTTLNNAIVAFLPQIRFGIREVFGSEFPFATALLFLLVIGAIFTFALKTRKITAEVKALVVGFVVFVFLVVLIDRHTPISTGRNFIVLLPMFSILAGMAGGELVKKSRALVVIAVVVFALSHIAGFWVYHMDLDGRIPKENHEAVAKFLVNSTELSGSATYLIAKSKETMNREEIMAEYYFDLVEKEAGIRLETILAEELSGIDPPYLLYFQCNETGYREVVRYFGLRNIRYHVYIPHQRGLGAVVIRVDSN